MASGTIYSALSSLVARGYLVRINSRVSYRVAEREPGLPSGR